MDEIKPQDFTPKIAPGAKIQLTESKWIDMWYFVLYFQFTDFVLHSLHAKMYTTELVA